MTPNWNSLSHHQIYGTEVAKLTEADVAINRKGNFNSSLYFLEVEGKMRNVIFTIYKKDTTSNGEIINASVYFNQINGKFIDGYIIKQGKFTKRIVVTEKIQEASFFSFFSFFQEILQDENCWNTDNLPSDGQLEEVNLGYVGGGIDFNHPFFQNNNANDNAGSNSNSNTFHGGGGSVTAVTGYIFAKMKPEDIGFDDCPARKVKDENDKCVCLDAYVEDSNGNCVCPKGYVEDSSGNCVKKPCEGNPVVGKLEIAPQKGPSGKKGALFGNPQLGGCTRYGSNACNTPRNKKHDGIDIKNAIGNNVHVMNSGFVYSSGFSNDYGYYAIIQSTINGKTILTTYAHMQKSNRIEQNKSGQPLVKVKAGDILGLQGDTGNIKQAIADGNVEPHVHIEIKEHDGSSKWSFKKNFNLVDPRTYLSTKIDNNGISQTNTNCN